MASAACRYEVDLYIFFERYVGSIVTTLWGDFSIEVFSNYKRSKERVTDQTGKTQIVTSQMQFYINFYFFLENLIMIQ